MTVRSADTIAEAHRLSRLAGEARITPAWKTVADRISGEATGGGTMWYQLTGSASSVPR